MTMVPQPQAPPTHGPRRPEHESQHDSARNASERTGEGAGSVTQRLLRERKQRTGPSDKDTDQS